MHKNQDVLFEYLKPLMPYLTDCDITEIAINEPGSIYIEQQGVMSRLNVADLTSYHLRGLVDLIAHDHGHPLNDKSPLLSGTLPSGHRVQIVIPPACETGKVIISLRKSRQETLTLAQLEQGGVFDSIQPCYLSHPTKEVIGAADAQLLTLFQQHHYRAFLKQAVIDKKNIIIAGATSSGKTTLLNACLSAIPVNERIITLEDVREIHITNTNAVHLLASHVSLQQLVEVALRLRPDRIIIGEIRGSEVIDFCHANQTGHNGSITTIHADHPGQVFDRLVQLMRRYSTAYLPRGDILYDWHQVVDVIVQMGRYKNQRVISKIYFAYASSGQC